MDEKCSEEKANKGRMQTQSLACLKLMPLLNSAYAPQNALELFLLCTVPYINAAENLIFYFLSKIEVLLIIKIFNLILR